MGWCQSTDGLRTPGSCSWCERGIRIAPGAGRSGVVRMVLREVATIVGV